MHSTYVPDYDSPCCPFHPSLEILPFCNMVVQKVQEIVTLFFLVTYDLASDCCCQSNPGREVGSTLHCGFTKIAFSPVICGLLTLIHCVSRGENILGVFGLWDGRSGLDLCGQHHFGSCCSALVRNLHAILAHLRWPISLESLTRVDGLQAM